MASWSLGHKHSVFSQTLAEKTPIFQYFWETDLHQWQPDELLRYLKKDVCTQAVPIKPERAGAVSLNNV